MTNNISLYMIRKMYNTISLLWEGKLQTTEYQATENNVHKHPLNFVPGYTFIYYMLKTFGNLTESFIKLIMH